jgi:hypothetical protein
MKKLTLALLLAFLVSASSTKAQSFQKGDNVIALGVGFGSSILSNSLGSQSPALSVSFEHASFEAGDDGVIGLGAYVGTKSYKYSGSSYYQKWNYTIIGVRGAYHYTALGDKIDVYGGVMLSYNALKYKDNYSGSVSIGNYGSGTTGFTAFVGGRYYFAEHIAAMAELGYGVSYLTVGLAFKF